MGKGSKKKLKWKNLELENQTCNTTDSATTTVEGTKMSAHRKYVAEKSTEQSAGKKSAENGGKKSLVESPPDCTAGQQE